MSKPRKPIADLIEELRSWLPNYDHGPNDFPTVFYRILADAPGAEELEDMGYEPIGNMGWHELDLLGRVLEAIQDKNDVEDLVQGLIRDEEGEVEEARSNPVEHKMTRREAETAWRRGNNNGEGYAPYTDIPGDDTIDNAVAAAEADGWTVIYPRNNTDQIVVLRNEDGEWMGIGGDASDQGAWAVSLTPGPGVKVRESAVRHDRVHWKGDFSNNPRSGTIRRKPPARKR